MDTVQLDMHTYSGPLFIDVDVWDKKKNRFKTGMLTFDTGATVTTISKEVLHHLGYDVQNGKVQRITTASGIEYVREVVVDKIRLGDIEIENVTAYAHNFPEEGFSTGVIGLNILSKFDISLLFSRRIIELTRISE